MELVGEINNILLEYVSKYLKLDLTSDDILTMDRQTKPGTIIVIYRDGERCHYSESTRLLHDTEGYAMRWTDGSKFNLVDGKLHSLTIGDVVLPSVVMDEATAFHDNGVLHRRCAGYHSPTVLLDDGTKMWIEKGMLHRDFDRGASNDGENLTFDSPGAAIERVDGNRVIKYWYRMGELVKTIKQPKPVQREVHITCEVTVRCTH